jgi:hypothetical protein
VAPTPPVSAPPVTAEYASQLQRTAPNLAPVQSAYRFTRAGNGSTRVDSGSTSVISNPAAGQTILLDHTKKTATVLPGPSATPSVPGIPQMPHFTPPGLPAALHAPTVQVQDLGKGVMQGTEVEGKRYLMQPPAMPKIPGMPQAPRSQAAGTPQVAGTPQAPQIPGMPQMPKAPQAGGIPQAPGTPGVPPAPKAPQAPTVAEVWTSTGMRLPMLTKMSGGFGQLTQVCQRAIPGEPHPAAFQIPPGYKVIVPAPPKPPALPRAPSP